MLLQVRMSLRISLKTFEICIHLLLYSTDKVSYWMNWETLNPFYSTSDDLSSMNITIQTFPKTKQNPHEATFPSIMKLSFLSTTDTNNNIHDRQ